jgi:hypothetical protein
MTRQRSYFFALAYLLSLTLAVYAAPDETNPSTTFTSTVNATILSTQTPSATVNLPDVQITDTLSSTKTLSAATKTVTKKLLGWVLHRQDQQRVLMLTIATPFD